MTRNSLVQEFVVSRDLEELLRCLKDINKPFYHHELVKSAIVHVLEEEQATKVNPAFLFNDTYSLSLNIYIYIEPHACSRVLLWLWQQKDILMSMIQDLTTMRIISLSQLEMGIQRVQGLILVYRIGKK